MKGKVILELEEYEELIRKNSNQIDTILEETNRLNAVRDHIDSITSHKVSYWMGGHTYYLDTNTQKLIDTANKQLIKNTSILKFIWLKR